MKFFRDAIILLGATSGVTIALLLCLGETALLDHFYDRHTCVSNFRITKFVYE